MEEKKVKDIDESKVTYEEQPVISEAEQKKQYFNNVKTTIHQGLYNGFINTMIKELINEISITKPDPKQFRKYLFHRWSSTVPKTITTNTALDKEQKKIFEIAYDQALVVLKKTVKGNIFKLDD
jgi:hypothetical protein